MQVHAGWQIKENHLFENWGESRNFYEMNLQEPDPYEQHVQYPRRIRHCCGIHLVRISCGRIGLRDRSIQS